MAVSGYLAWQSFRNDFRMTRDQLSYKKVGYVAIGSLAFSGLFCFWKFRQLNQELDRKYTPIWLKSIGQLKVDKIENK
jgi:hypothetical protein